MCLAIPACIQEIAADGTTGMAEVNGVRRTISLMLLDEVAVGDYVLVHVGHALSRLDPDEARRTLDLFAELAARPEAPAILSRS